MKYCRAGFVGKEILKFEWCDVVLLWVNVVTSYLFIQSAPRQPKRRITVRDVVFFMEGERETRKSLLLYKSLFKWTACLLQWTLSLCLSPCLSYPPCWEKVVFNFLKPCFCTAKKKKKNPATFFALKWLWTLYNYLYCACTSIEFILWETPI